MCQVIVLFSNQLNNLKIFIELKLKPSKQTFYVYLYILFFHHINCPVFQYRNIKPSCWFWFCTNKLYTFMYLKENSLETKLYKYQ